MVGKSESSRHGTSYQGLSKQVRIARAGKALCSGYRIDQFADSDGFALQCAVLFEKYDIAVVEHLTDVRNWNCLQLRYKWPPTLQEISEAFDEETLHRDRVAKAAHQSRKAKLAIPARDSYPGCRCNVFVHAEAPQYAIVRAWSETDEADTRDYMEDANNRPGIWVALYIFVRLNTHGAKVGGWKSPSDAELRAYYGKREQEAKASNGGGV